MSLKNLNAIKKNHKVFYKKLRFKRIDQIYKKFEKNLSLNKNFAVAVSGGPDSLALAFLSKIYSIKKNLKSYFFIVDHKLRKESTEEATKVKKILKKFSIDCKILTWNKNKFSKKTQSEARKNRYKLLFSECNKKKIGSILIGHHQDDLFENFFIRMLRGSGLRGLVSLNKITQNSNINLIRPLLDFKKEDLIYLSNNVFNFYVNDPFNKDKKYKRIVVRNILEELEEHGLDKDKLNLTIQNLKKSDEVIKFHVSNNVTENSFFHDRRNQLILNDKFFNQPREIVFRSLSDMIKKVGQKYYLIRGKKLEKIISSIKKNSLKKATLGGCLIKKVNQTVILSKEK